MATTTDSLRDLQRSDYAFPFEVTSEDGNASYFCSGMKLRDYFAAKALQAFIERDKSNSLREDTLAELAYTHADAMIRMRGPKR